MPLHSMGCSLLSGSMVAASACNQPQTKPVLYQHPRSKLRICMGERKAPSSERLPGPKLCKETRLGSAADAGKPTVLRSHIIVISLPTSLRGLLHSASKTIMASLTAQRGALSQVSEGDGGDGGFSCGRLLQRQPGRSCCAANGQLAGVQQPAIAHFGVHQRTLGSQPLGVFLLPLFCRACPPGPAARLPSLAAALLCAQRTSQVSPRWA
jgi:hypothetical protein